MKTMVLLLEELDRDIESENERRRREEKFQLPKAEIVLLGQMSLLAHPNQLEAKLHLTSTVDVDALIRAEYVIRKLFLAVLKRNNLVYDEDSEKIWIPPESTYTTLFDTNRLKCIVLDPLFAITSKAIKAKEKNQFLVALALPIFGKSLENLIVKYKGDLEYFRKVQ